MCIRDSRVAVTVDGAVEIFPLARHFDVGLVHAPASTHRVLSLIHISEPTRLLSISYAVFCLKTNKELATQLLPPDVYMSARMSQTLIFIMCTHLSI